MNLSDDTYRRKIKILNISEQIFPYFFPKRMLLNYFEFVDSNPDIVFLPIINEEVEQNPKPIEYWAKYLDLPVQHAIFHTIDEFSNQTKFSSQAQMMCHQCRFVFGHQLPVDLDPQKFIPIMYPARVLPQNKLFQDLVEPNDIFFWGAYQKSPQYSLESIPISLPVRDRKYRGTIISIIEQLQIKYQWTTDFKQIYYWQKNPARWGVMQRAYRNHMSLSKLCLAPFGFGYNSYRISEIFAARKVLFSSKIFNHVLVPEVGAWENEEIGFFFSDDCSDLENLLVTALSDEKRRKYMAQNGRKFFEKHCTYKGLINTVYSAFIQGL